MAPTVTTTRNPPTQTTPTAGLSVASSFEGRFNLSGWLTPEGGATLKVALDALSRPVADDTRTAAHRYADALVELARRQLNDGDLPAKHGVRPHLFAVVNADISETPKRLAPASTGLAVRFIN